MVNSMLGALSALEEGNYDETCRCRPVQSKRTRSFDNFLMIGPDNNMMNLKQVEIKKCVEIKITSSAFNLP